MTGDLIFYIVELDLPDADLDGFLAWYANVHAPHLYEAGFRLCTSYRAVAGEMSLVDIYQAAGPEIFTSPSFSRYREVFAADPYRPGYIGRNRNTRTPYHPVRWDEGGAFEPDRPLSADWITVCRFAPTITPLEAVAERLRSGLASALNAWGAAHIRLLRKGAEAPTGSSIRPAGCLVVEWEAKPPTEAEALLSAAGLRQGGDASGFEGFRLYPWPDAKSLRHGTAPADHRAGDEASR